MKSFGLIRICALLLTVLLCAGAFAGCGGRKDGQQSGAAPVSVEQAKETAFDDMGVTEADVTLLTCKLDDGKYEVSFLFEGVEYDYEMSASTGKILSKETENKGADNGSADNGGTVGAIDADQAKKTALDDAGATEADVTFLTCKLDGREYDVSFLFNGVEYDYEISASTGKILSKETENKGADNGSADNGGTVGAIDAEQAKKTALDDAGAAEADVSFLKCKLDGREYDVSFLFNGVEYDYEISASTGKILSKETENKGTGNNGGTVGVIDVGQAKKTALDDAGAAEADVTFLTCKLDGREYDVSFLYNGVEYDYEISASTGKILSKETENKGAGTVGAAISAEQAKKTAFDAAGVAEADCRKVECELDDGKYEVSFVFGRIEYEYEIDAKTGGILHAETSIDD